MLTERAPHLLNCVSENLKFLNGRVIGIDIDGTTQATYELALKKASLKLRKNIIKDQIVTYWETVEIIKKNGVPESEALDFAKGIWNDKRVLGKSPEMSGIRALLEVFNELKVPYVFISSRPVEFGKITREWFKETFPWVPGENIILGRKEGVRGGDFKAEMIQKFGIGLHIDDAREEAEIIAKTTKIPVLIVPQPWNIDNSKVEITGVKHLGDYDERAGAWPILRFLVRKDSKDFFDSVAQCH